LIESSVYVLVPGAWHAGWAWEPVAKRLRAAGHRTLTVTMPGTGHGDDPSGVRLQDGIDHLVREIERRDLTDVVLVGHSWSGYPVTAAAHRLAGRITGLVYCSAHVPVPGRSHVEDDPPEVAALFRDLIGASPTGSIAPLPLFARELFLQDADPGTQDLVADLLSPMPGGYFLDALDLPDPIDLGLPMVYLLAEADNAMPRPGTEMAARLGLTPVLVPGNHDNLLTHPDELAKAILAVGAVAPSI
jgi:pimeloyl-ACP methyl ester carboxylesterase